MVAKRAAAYETAPMHAPCMHGSAYRRDEV